MPSKIYSIIIFVNKNKFEVQNMARKIEHLMQRMNTGIPGYDDLLEGGYFRDTVNIVIGESGTGKTVFGSQFLYSGTRNGEKGLCIMTSESAAALKREMFSSFGWDLWALEESGMLFFVDIANPELRLQKTIDMAPTELIKSFKKLITHKIEELAPERIFIDSIEALFLAIDSQYKLRTLADDLFGLLREENVTSIISAGTTHNVSHIMEYCADSVTRLDRQISKNSLKRSIYVSKLRGSATLNQIYVLDITDAGINVVEGSSYSS